MTKPLRGRVIEPTFPLLGGISAGTVMPRNEGNVETLPATSRKQKAQRHPLYLYRLAGLVFLPPDASPTITPLEREHNNHTAW